MPTEKDGVVFIGYLPDWKDQSNIENLGLLLHIFVQHLNEFAINYKDIIPLPHKESIVPYKICSFDIEASSSHGDFTLAKKNYVKLATNIADICQQKYLYDAKFIK